MEYIQIGPQKSQIEDLKCEIFRELDRDFIFLVDSVLKYEKRYCDLGQQECLDAFLQKAIDYSFSVNIIVQTLDHPIVHQMRSYAGSRKTKVWLNQFVPSQNAYLYVEPALALVHRDGWGEIYDDFTKTVFIMSPVLRDSSLIQGFRLKSGVR